MDYLCDMITRYRYRVQIRSKGQGWEKSPHEIWSFARSVVGTYLVYAHGLSSPQCLVLLLIIVGKTSPFFFPIKTAHVFNF